MTQDRHIWSEDDDARLLDEVQTLSGVLPKKVNLWSAVCGRLAPDVVVTPDAARTRWRRVRQLQQAAEEQERLEEDPRDPPVESSWDRCERLVDEHEQDQLERIEGSLADLHTLLLDTLAQNDRRLEQIEKHVLYLRAVWGGG